MSPRGVVELVLIGKSRVSFKPCKQKNRIKLLNVLGEVAL